MATSEPPPLQYRFTNGSSSEKIPFDLNTNKPYLQVRVNATGPYTFIMDTGSIAMVVDSELAALLGVQSGESFESSGAGEGTLAGATGNGVLLGLEGLDISTGPIDILPINKAIAFSEGRRVDGLLGYEFFASFVVTIDYANRQVSIYDPQANNIRDVPGTGTVLPLELVRGNPFVSAELTTSAGKRLAGYFLVDTAWRSALSLNAPFVVKHGLLESTATIEAITGVGVGGSSVEAVGRVQTLQLGSIAVQNPVANFSRAKAGILSQSDMSGIIGGDVLRRFTVTFDYPHKRIILEPNALFAEPYEFDMCGFMATAEGDDLRTLRIYDLIESSPASEAGLRKGDVITEINGHPAEGMSLEDVRKLFRRDAGREHEICVQRDGQSHKATVRLRRLV
jgi:hypothetical protein